MRGLVCLGMGVQVGAAFMSHNVSLPDGKSMRFEIWDTAGQERYLSLAPLYYRCMQSLRARQQQQQQLEQQLQWHGVCSSYSSTQWGSEAVSCSGSVIAPPESSRSSRHGWCL